MNYDRETRRHIRRLYKLSQRREWCDHYPCCGHFRCQDRFWHHLNLQTLMRGIAQPGGKGIAAHYREERLRMEWKALNLREETVK